MITLLALHAASSGAGDALAAVAGAVGLGGAATSILGALQRRRDRKFASEVAADARSRGAQLQSESAVLAQKLDSLALEAQRISEELDASEREDADDWWGVDPGSAALRTRPALQELAHAAAFQGARNAEQAYVTLQMLDDALEKQTVRLNKASIKMAVGGFFAGAGGSVLVTLLVHPIH